MPQSEVPREAVEEAALAVSATMLDWGDDKIEVWDSHRLLAEEALFALRTLPPAARWRLIAWLAEGLEPTEAMRVNGGLALEKAMFEEDGTLIFEAASACCTAMLAAAREADDAG